MSRDKASSRTSEQSTREGDAPLFDSSEEDLEFHDCRTELETLYLSFEGRDVMEEKTEVHFEDVTENNNTHNRSESEGFYSCRSDPKGQEETVTSEIDVVEKCSPEPEVPSHSLGRLESEVSVDLIERRRMAFALRDSEVDPVLSDRTASADSTADVQSSEATPLPSCSLAESFRQEEKTSADVTSGPDMLVTLTTTDIGISAKREDSLERPLQSMSRTLDSIPDNTIFDKAQLVEEALDTADINKCLTAKREARLNALPSLRRQEQYSDETRSHRHPSSGSSLAQIMPSLPSYRMEAAAQHSGDSLVRVNSAPGEMKDDPMMAEDAEITSILGNAPCFNAMEDRSLSSLSEPFPEVVQTPQDGCKKFLTSWVQRKMHFVSFDTDSDVASLTRSEYIMEMKRGKERRNRHRSRPSSRFTQVSSRVNGPSVSPVPPGGIRDFNNEDAIALNAVLRKDPQLRNVPMGIWTSKLVGFATPADYYVHMIHELSADEINVLALIKAKLGEHHPLVMDIIEKLRNYTTEVPSFILSSMSRGHKRTPPIAPHQRLPLYSHGESQDFHQSVEEALIQCGVNMAFFDKMRGSFVNEVEYYEYIAGQIKSAGFVVSIRKVKELLGSAHPFVRIFRTTVVTECDCSSRTSSLSDSARSIPSASPTPSPGDASLPKSKESTSVHLECEVENDGVRGRCLFSCLPSLQRSLLRSKHRKNQTIS